MINYWINSQNIVDQIFIPKYYDPNLENEINQLRKTHNIFIIKDLVESNAISISTGHEIGKMAYGTGDIPFIRTSDISNWELKTSPKQGVSEDIYEEYRKKQDVRKGDILLVRDGTYLIGTNCIITELDKKILYQSHILKIRININEFIDSYLFFLAINSEIVQKQIRSIQFTADTIDTIGNRFLEIRLAIPKDKAKQDYLKQQIIDQFNVREKGRAFIKQSPIIIEEVLSLNTVAPIDTFFQKKWSEILKEMNQDTVTSEFGYFETFWINSDDITDGIYLPKYYDPDIKKELDTLKRTCECYSIDELVEKSILTLTTGDEIGKMAYGTGSIPFIRTSDFSNWEIKHDPKQGISNEIYMDYKERQDVQTLDILLVRDGTYLVGTTAIITENDTKILYCGGLYKIRVSENEKLDAWLLLGLLNSYIVKRQLRTKQFTRDVIDTLGKRLGEVIIPIPKDKEVRNQLSYRIKNIILSRINARHIIKELSHELNCE